MKGRNRQDLLNNLAGFSKKINDLVFGKIMLAYFTTDSNLGFNQTAKRPLLSVVQSLIDEAPERDLSEECNPRQIFDKFFSFIDAKDDVDSLKEKIARLRRSRMESSTECLEMASQHDYIKLPDSKDELEFFEKVFQKLTEIQFSLAELKYAVLADLTIEPKLAVINVLYSDLLRLLDENSKFVKKEFIQYLVEDLDVAYKKITDTKTESDAERAEAFIQFKMTSYPAFLSYLVEFCETENLGAQATELKVFELLAELIEKLQNNKDISDKFISQVLFAVSNLADSKPFVTKFKYSQQAEVFKKELYSLISKDKFIVEAQVVAATPAITAKKKARKQFVDLDKAPTVNPGVMNESHRQLREDGLIPAAAIREPVYTPRFFECEMVQADKQVVKAQPIESPCPAYLFDVAEKPFHFVEVEPVKQKISSIQASVVQKSSVVEEKDEETLIIESFEDVSKARNVQMPLIPTFADKNLIKLITVPIAAVVGAFFGGIAGIALAPFTGGTSLLLTLACCGVLAASFAGAGYAVGNRIDNNRLQKIEDNHWKKESASRGEGIDIHKILAKTEELTLEQGITRPASIKMTSAKKVEFNKPKGLKKIFGLFAPKQPTQLDQPRRQTLEV